MAHAQDEEELVFTKVEINASTDPKQWKAHIQRQSVLPDSLVNKLPEGNYRAVVQFIVDQHGSVGQVKLLKDPGHGLGRRAIRMVNNYKGKWTPSVQCGRAVRAYREEVIVFIVKHEGKTEGSDLNN